MPDNQTPETENQHVFDIYESSAETTYANTTQIIVGEGDVTIYFGFQQIEASVIPASNVKRIVMTHDSFMRMMEFWAARYHLLASLYNGKPITLRDIDPKLVSAAFESMLGRGSEEVK